MSNPILTYPEAVFNGKWPGWNAFLGAEKVEKAKVVEKKKVKRKSPEEKGSIK